MRSEDGEDGDLSSNGASDSSCSNIGIRGCDTKIIEESIDEAELEMNLIDKKDKHSEKSSDDSSEKKKKKGDSSKKKKKRKKGDSSWIFKK